MAKEDIDFVVFNTKPLIIILPDQSFSTDLGLEQ
jgi:hypothetical protein